MLKNVENNGTEEIVLVTPTSGFAATNTLVDNDWWLDVNSSLPRRIGTFLTSILISFFSGIYMVPNDANSKITLHLQQLETIWRNGANQTCGGVYRQFHSLRQVSVKFSQNKIFIGEYASEHVLVDCTHKSWNTWN